MAKLRKGLFWSLPLLIVGAALMYWAVAPPAHTMLGAAAGLVFDDVNPRSATYGKKLVLGELYAERGVVLRFIASWCDVCRGELPELQQMYADRHAPIVLMAADEYGPPDSLLVVAERNALTAPILFVPEERVAELERSFAYEILPATYLIDRKGTIRLAHEGAMPPARLAREMERALGL